MAARSRLLSSAPILERNPEFAVAVADDISEQLHQAAVRAVGDRTAQLAGARGPFHR
jgi:hypothetical protein